MARRNGPNGAVEDASVLARLKLLRGKDASFSLGQVVGSMCTAPHPLAVEAHLLFQQSNLGDPGHFPGSRRIEKEYVDHLFRLAGGRPRGAGGQVTSGATEANVLALTLMRQSTGRSEVVVPQTGHFSFEKAAKLLGMRLRIADVDRDYRVKPSAVARLVGPQTAGVVGIAGSTQVGSVDPLPELAQIAADAQVPLHVDAAFGGYVLPFLPKGHAAATSFGFDLDGVTTVAVDSHKMGMGTIGAGALLVRHEKLMDHFSVPTPYLSTPRQRGMLGTRSAGPVAAAWSLFEALGDAGYRRVVAGCLEATERLVAGLGAAGVRPLIEPPLNIVAVPCRRPTRVQQALSARGWRVNVLPRLKAVRVVLMPHVDVEVVEAFLPDLIDVLRSDGGGAAGRRRDRPVAQAG